VPLFFSLWFTARFSDRIAFEFGAWWTYVAFAPVLLAIWAATTVFPFMLTAKLRGIQRGC